MRKESFQRQSDKSPADHDLFALHYPNVQVTGLGHFLKEGTLTRVKYSVEQILHKLREPEVLLGQGQRVKDSCPKWNITDPTYYGWRQVWWPQLDQPKRLCKNIRLNERV